MKKTLPMLLCFLGIVGGYVIFYPEILNLCDSVNGYYRNCLWGRDIGKALGEPLFSYSLVFLPASLALLFVRKETFNSWLRFARWWILLSFVLILITPTSSNTWMPLYSVDKEIITWIMAILFTLISLILIAVKSFSLRKTKT
jgi:hypothetical protein